MGMILAKTFDGHKMRIPAEDDPKIKIDCMFFTSTCEPLKPKSMDNEVQPQAKYKKLPTFLLCNPNAMFY